MRKPFLILICLFLAAACSSEKEHGNRGLFRAPDEEIPADAEIHTGEVVLHNFEDGKKIWEISAASSSSGETAAFVEKPVIYIYNNNEVYVIIKGEQAVVKDEIITITNEVHARYLKETAECFTDNIFYIPKEGKIYTDDFIKFIKGGLVMKGEGMEYGIEEGVLQIKRNIKGEFQR